VKYTHPSTAAVAHVTVASDAYETDVPGVFDPEGQLPRMPPDIRGFSSRVEFAGDGSPRRSSLKNSSFSSPDEGPWSSSSPRVSFEHDAPIATQEANAAAAEARHSASDVGLIQEVESGGTDKKASKSKKSDAGKEAKNANKSANNPQLNINRNASESTKDAGNVFVYLYRKLFRKNRDPQQQDVAVASASDNTRVNNRLDETLSTTSSSAVSTTCVDIAGVSAAAPSAETEAAAASVGRESDDSVDDDDDDESETTTESDDDDLRNEHTRLLRQRRQPLRHLAQLCRTSFRRRTTGGDPWLPRRPPKKLSGRWRYDAVEATSSDW